ncbi:Uma2 family endonuclease [Roseomonas sp. GCM10028921]
MSDALQPTYVSREDYRRIVAERSGRFERIDGRIVPMAQERASHNRRKQAIWLALHSAVLKARLPCEAFGEA